MAVPDQSHIDAAWTSYRLAKPEDGIAHARLAVAADASDGESWYALACNLERIGQLHEADRAFLHAERAPERSIVAPFRVSWSRFQRSVKTACDVLPPDLRNALAEITLVTADYAEPYLLEAFDDPEVMGMFEGATRAESDNASGVISPRIHLWRRSHEHACTSAKDFDNEVKQTLHHELGHYLGYDEEDLEQLGMD